MHQAKSGRIIIKLEDKVDPGEVLLDAKGRKVARIVELIGPTKSPYGSAIPLTDRIKRASKDKLYIR